MAERSADILIKPAQVKSPSRISASENKFPIRIVSSQGGSKMVNSHVQRIIGGKPVKPKREVSDKPQVSFGDGNGESKLHDDKNDSAEDIQPEEDDEYADLIQEFYDKKKDQHGAFRVDSARYDSGFPRVLSSYNSKVRAGSSIRRSPDKNNIIDASKDTSHFVRPSSIIKEVDPKSAHGKETLEKVVHFAPQQPKPPSALAPKPSLLGPSYKSRIPSSHNNHKKFFGYAEYPLQNHHEQYPSAEERNNLRGILASNLAYRSHENAQELFPAQSLSISRYNLLADGRGQRAEQQKRGEAIFGPGRLNLSFLGPSRKSDQDLYRRYVNQLQIASDLRERGKHLRESLKHKSYDLIEAIIKEFSANNIAKQNPKSNGEPSFQSPREVREAQYNSNRLVKQTGQRVKNFDPGNQHVTSLASGNFEAISGLHREDKLRASSDAPIPIYRYSHKSNPVFV